MVCAASVNSTPIETAADFEPIILASASPRRRDLLAEMGVAFDVVVSPLHEPAAKPADLPAPVWAEALAFFKARSVANRHTGVWVLGADTIVLCAGRVLGKPMDADDARSMLELQAGTASDVITGVALVRVDESGAVRRIVDHDVTQVWMRDDRDVREEYVSSGDWAGKAGAYGIQDVGDRLVERFEGSFSNVMGLPVELLARLLARLTTRN